MKFYIEFEERIMRTKIIEADTPQEAIEVANALTDEEVLALEADRTDFFLYQIVDENERVVFSDEEFGFVSDPDEEE